MLDASAALAVKQVHRVNLRCVVGQQNLPQYTVYSIQSPAGVKAQAEALYQCGEFEQSLLQYCRCGRAVSAVLQLRYCRGLRNCSKADTADFSRGKVHHSSGQESRNRFLSSSSYLNFAF